MRLLRRNNRLVTTRGGTRYATKEGCGTRCCGAAPANGYILAVDAQLLGFEGWPAGVPIPAELTTVNPVPKIAIPAPFLCPFGSTMCPVVVGQLVYYGNRNRCYIVIDNEVPGVPSTCVPGRIVAPTFDPPPAGFTIVDPLDVRCIAEAVATFYCPPPPVTGACCDSGRVQGVSPCANLGPDCVFGSRYVLVETTYATQINRRRSPSGDGTSEVTAQGTRRTYKYSVIQTGRNVSGQCDSGIVEYYERQETYANRYGDSPGTGVLVRFRTSPSGPYTIVTNITGAGVSYTTNLPRVLTCTRGGITQTSTLCELGTPPASGYAAVNCPDALDPITGEPQGGIFQEHSYVNSCLESRYQSATRERFGIITGYDDDGQPIVAYSPGPESTYFAQRRIIPLVGCEQPIPVYATPEEQLGQSATTIFASLIGGV